MLFEKTEKCRQCPFRRGSAKGWLGDYTAAEVVTEIQTEQPFYCHSEIDYDDEGWQDTLDGVNHCAGALQFAKCIGKLPRDRNHSKAVRDIKVEADTIGTIDGFLQHHKVG